MTHLKQAFNSLASETTLRRKILDQGGGAVIIALAISSHNRSLRRDCVEAICKLSALEGSEVEIMNEGGVPCLLAVIRTVPALGEICLKALINLSYVGTHTDSRLGELNDAALQLSGLIEEKESLERLLIQLLCNLSCFKSNQQKLVEDGAIRIVAKAAERMHSAEVTHLCASTLCNFAGDSRARPKMSDQRTAQALLDLTRHEEGSIRQEVAHTVARLVMDVSCREKILQYGIIPILIRICCTPGVDTLTSRQAYLTKCRYIALAFRVLASDRKYAEIIVEGGAVKGVIKLAAENDRATQFSCAACLCHLIRYTSCLAGLIERGVVRPLVRLAKSGDNLTSECCAAALYLLFCHPDSLSNIDGTEVIRSLLDLCKVGTTSIRKKCAAAIWNLTNVEQGVKGGGTAAESIPTLLQLLQSESDRELKADCAAALYNLAQSPENCQAMILSGAVPPIILLANTGSFDTKTQCMSILQRMLLGRAMPKEIMTPSFVRTLLEISRIEDRDTQQRVVIAIYRISCNREGRRLLLSEGVTESLIRLISKPNEEMRKGCANTLLNLASDWGSEMEIIRSGAVSVLLITALVACDSEDARHACTKAIVNLLCEPKAHRSMFNDGVVWGLATMSRSGDITVARLCAGALCNLTHEYWREIATSSSMQAVFSLANSSDEAVMSAAVKAIYNILAMCSTPAAENTQGLTHLFSWAVPVARRLLEHSSKEIRLVGLRITYLATTAAGARVAATHQRLLHRINVDDFDNDEILCHAFCCALENLAIDADTRSAALTSGCVTNFPVLSAVSERIFARLAMFMYCVSCSTENVPELVFDHDCVQVVAAVMELRATSNKHSDPLTSSASPTSPVETSSNAVKSNTAGVEVRESRSISVLGVPALASPTVPRPSLSAVLCEAWHTCSALLFNLSTQDIVKTELVLLGSTKLAFALWEGGGPETRRNCSLVACNLAMGKVVLYSEYFEVNTAKMVRHGAGQLLVDLVSNTDNVSDSAIRHRASAAFRNLLCVSGNHVRLADEGAIPALIELAAADNRDIKRNCASALRSMTCKAQVREVLVESGAINVILEDAQEQDSDESVLIDNDLLCEIEAESWVNGTRGILVESRALALPGLPQNTSLLPTTQNTQQGAHAMQGQPLYSLSWEKLQALDVTLQEPDMVASTKQSAANRFDDIMLSGLSNDTTDFD
ncbi:unnamed protein product, partial [Discosporangium mesarthrocarpum]